MTRRAPRPLRLVVLSLALAACRGSGAPAAAAVTTRETRLAGVTLHTSELGARARPVRLVVHGGPGLDHTYLRPYLDPLGSDGRAVYVDLRGHGRSSSPPSAEGYTIDAAADDLAALVRARRDGPVDVVAHDFGAAVTVALAARHPEVVRRVVLVAPLRDAGQVARMGPRSREVLGDAGWRAVLALSTPQGTLRDPRSLPELLARLGPMWWHRTPPEATLRALTRRVIYRADADANYILEAQRWDARLRAAEVRAPALVLSGDDDRSYPPEESRALADALPHGRFALVPGAGHLPFVENTAEFLRLVRAFLAGGGE